MSKVTVSIIMPAYNSQLYIQSSIESILAQDFDDFELIVVDDGSTDETPKIISEFPSVHYYHQENNGVASARNLGALHSSGKYLAFIDADDLWETDKLSKQINYMEDHPEIGYSFTHHKLFLTDQLSEYPTWVRSDYQDNQLTAFVPSALIVSKSCFEKVGPFNKAFRVSEDSDWFFRARDLGMKYAVIEEALLLKRVHQSNLSSDTSMIQRNLLKATRDSIVRRNQFKISVIIPVYNGQSYLSEAVSSVLNQSFKPFEIILVDDGSTDNTRQIYEGLDDKIKYIYQDNAGAAAARNNGIEHASGNYLAFLDADDLWTTNRLQDGISHLMLSEADEMVFGLIEEFYSPETDELFRSKYKCSNQAIKGIHPGTLLMKKSTFLDVGLFSSKYVTGEFIEWYGRAQEKDLEAHIIQATHMHRRIHPANHGIIEKSSTDDYAKIIRDMLLRKRAQKNESK